MTVLNIVTYPDEQLRTKSKLVTDFQSEEFGCLIEDMADTVTRHQAHGLAAIQIGVPLRVFCLNTSETGIQFFVNPEVEEEACPPKIKFKEGCLSFPGVEEFVERREDISVTALDESGEEFTMDFYGLESVAIQHEVDHLDGVLFIDRVSPIKKRYLLKSYRKQQKRLTKEYGR